MIASRFDQARILIYSHDTFGLGHLRRCREIAHALVATYRGLTVMLISGATIAGAFDYRARVDFVKIPSVIKLRNGEYTSLARHMRLEDTLAMRRSIIRHTAETFRPDIFITDKEPMGLQGEIEETLASLKAAGTHMVLGLREVMDAPQLLAREWARADMLTKIERYYDTIWVYGPAAFYDPLVGLDASEAVRARMRFTGYLQRSLHRSGTQAPRQLGDYVLVTTGGGGDGADLVRNVFDAHRADPTLDQRTIVVLGPYLPGKERNELLAAAAGLPNIEVIEFDNRMEELIAGARAVVGMGGYNTYCEILSFDRPALVVPRTSPRQEQEIRARRAAELGILQLVLPDEAADPVRFAAALKALPVRPRPSLAEAATRAGALDIRGLQRIAQDVGTWLEARHSPRLALLQG